MTVYELREDGTGVDLHLSFSDLDEIIVYLGIAAANSSYAAQIVRFANKINDGNPRYRKYTDEDIKMMEKRLKNMKSEMIYLGGEL